MPLYPRSESRIPTPMFAMHVDFPVLPLPHAVGKIAVEGMLPFRTMLPDTGLSSVTSCVLIGKPPGLSLSESIFQVKKSILTPCGHQISEVGYYSPRNSYLSRAFPPPYWSAIFVNRQPSPSAYFFLKYPIGFDLVPVTQTSVDWRRRHEILRQRLLSYKRTLRFCCGIKRQRLGCLQAVISNPMNYQKMRPCAKSGKKLGCK